MKRTERHRAAGPLQRPWRAVLIGCVLAPLNVFWVIRVDAFGQHGMHLSAMSLFFNVLFTLSCLLLLNIALTRMTPRLALRSGELVIIFVMLNVATGIGGIGFMRLLSQVVAFPFWYATSENEWAKLIQPHVPRWLTVADRSILADYYQGDSTFYAATHLRAWAKPVLAWSAFITALIGALLFVNLLVRRRWVEEEKLPYVIVQLPLSMIDNRSGIFRNRLLWAGVAVAGGIDLLNGISFIYPFIPNLYVKMTDIGKLFGERPWNAMGWTPIAFYPFVIGIGFLIPLDLSLSFWFFYLTWKLQAVALAAVGNPTAQRYGFNDAAVYTSTGAFLALTAWALWNTRAHLASVWSSAVRGDPADEREPFSCRFIVLGLAACSHATTLFLWAAGMSAWVIALFLMMYVGICVAITRMRVEMGVPVHDHHGGGPDRILPIIFGTRELGPRNLTIMAYSFFFNRVHYSDVMPHQLEGFRLADRTETPARPVAVAMMVSVPLGAVTAFWAILHFGHDLGMQGRIEHAGYEPFNRLANWIAQPQSPELGALGSLATGATLFSALTVARNRFIWWPLHPAGFAVSNSWGASVTWFPIFLGWLLKAIVLRSGGIGSYRRAVPFFFGLVIGEAVVGSGWSLWGLLTGNPHYTFFPYGR